MFRDACAAAHIRIGKSLAGVESQINLHALKTTTRADERSPADVLVVRRGATIHNAQVVLEIDFGREGLTTAIAANSEWQLSAVRNLGFEQQGAKKIDQGFHSRSIRSLKRPHIRQQQNRDQEHGDQQEHSGA